LKYSSPNGFNSFGLEETKEISKIPRLLGDFKWGLYFSYFFFEKSSSIELKIDFIITHKEMM